MWIANTFFGLTLAVTCLGQSAPAPDDGGSPQKDGPRQVRGFGGQDRMPPPGGPGGPGGPNPAFGPPGRWWDEPEFIQKLSLSNDQKKKMDDIFNTYRLKLIDLVASLQKEEAIMEPLVQADPPDDNKVLAQIDRVAQARAELEKSRARMALDLRRQLTHDQWTKLQEMRPPRHKGPPPPFPPPGSPAPPGQQ